MSWQGWLQIALFAALVAAAVRQFGAYIARVLDGGCTPEPARLRSPADLLVVSNHHAS